MALLRECLRAVRTRLGEDEPPPLPTSGIHGKGYVGTQPAALPEASDRRIEGVQRLSLPTVLTGTMGGERDDSLRRAAVEFLQRADLTPSKTSLVRVAERTNQTKA